MDQPASSTAPIFPLKWVANFLVAFVLFFLVAFTLFTAWEYWQLNSVVGDAGYPFGVEESGTDYATKEVYLAGSRWIIAVGGALSAVMIFGLLRRKPILTWIGWLATIAFGFILFARSNA